MLGEQFVKSPEFTENQYTEEPFGVVNQITNVENAEVLQQYMPLRNRRSIEANQGSMPSTTSHLM